jgi:hypothetical protein
MSIDDLLSPYRGYKPTIAALVAENHARTPQHRGPDLPSPETWHMFEFVQSLTA